VNRFDVLVTLLGSPHESDSISTALSLVEAMLERRARVSVWACGNATFLTSDALELSKPRNVFAGDMDYPTSAAYVGDLLAKHDGRFEWAVCHFCSHERGATSHIGGVRMRPAMFFPRFVKNADKTLTVGRL